ncbi:hypothetical protein BWI93_20675 [Siphonobacter sp. BAB-5385]|uniref:FecR family protein n=1 Tax=Siphonobacter sp. BAB-5385 TaxID=1864822 RepID=UPI000B9E20FB|nr:FecR domain-containing protein [Siphonobacter sp. BAB-5385]OZI06234.1 hypothetical protein BWI93_20675 [Siphonobacter sp. BAB-5385]
MDQKPDLLQDFIGNPSFRKWVNDPDASTVAHWESYRRKHPEQEAVIRQAATVVRRLKKASTELAQVQPDPRKEEEIWQSVRQQLFPAPVRRSFAWGWVAAAVVVLGIGLSWTMLQPAEAPQLAQVTPIPQPDSVTISNVNTKPRLVSLPDGSSVILQKGSNLRYENPFRTQNRMVSLSGEAYFEVVRDTTRPFLVYANGLVAKVLGTSFNIKAYNRDNNVILTVRTGKVSVSSHKVFEDASKEADDLVLQPNEQVVFARKESRLFRSPVNTLVEAKTLVLRPVNLVYNAVPVSEVIAEIERTYGIKVIFQNPSLSNCRITTDLKEGTLSQKLDIICKTIEANWAAQENFVAVSGRGCRP